LGSPLWVCLHINVFNISMQSTTEREVYITTELCTAGQPKGGPFSVLTDEVFISFVVANPEP